MASKSPAAKSPTKTPTAKSPSKSPTKGGEAPTPAAASPDGKRVKGSGSPSPNRKAKDVSPVGKKGRKGRGGKPEKEEAHEPVNVGEPAPEGMKAVMIISRTQGEIGINPDVDVTRENPFKMIRKEIVVEDITKYGGISDFASCREAIQNYPEEEILFQYDFDLKYGQNFLICLDPVVKAELLKLNEKKEEVQDILYEYKPPQPKPWLTYGSEMELSEAAVVPTREKITFNVVRRRREFGAAVEFTDRSWRDTRDGYVEIPPFRDERSGVEIIEKEIGIQAVPDIEMKSAQTSWPQPQNKAVQYVPREFGEEERQAHLDKPETAESCKNCYDSISSAMVQNEVLNIFIDDYEELAADDDAFGNKADHHLKEFQSFTDLRFSKNKRITAIDWHPLIKGIVGVSCADRMQFNQRVDNSHQLIMTPSLILVWSFADPINPQLLLEAPDDIIDFKFSPSEPNVVVAGCFNGQIVLWDIADQVEQLKNARASQKSGEEFLPGFDDDSQNKGPPVVRYCAVSSIEHSHKGAITDIQWIPDHFELNRMGLPSENPSQKCCQLMTAAIDHSVLVWDTRPPRGVAGGQDNKLYTGVSKTFRYLDLTWKPLLRVSLPCSDPGGDFSPTKFSISERQGDRSALGGAKTTEKEDSSAGLTGGFVPGTYNASKAGDAKKKILQTIKTRFYVGTEDGQLVYVDWMPQKDQETGKVQTPKADFYTSIHGGPICCMQRSPFFRDILLVAGGFTFSIWKEGVHTGPLLHSGPAPAELTSGYWSPSRPGVFYIGRADGSVDVWDMTDKTHGPSMTQNISAQPVTVMFPTKVTNKHHLLAVGDNNGTLFILEIPWNLRTPAPNEHKVVEAYLEREMSRRAFVKDRWDFREEEKRLFEREAALKAGVGPAPVLTEEEMAMKMKMEYAEYQDFEFSILRALGLVKDDEERDTASAR